MITYITHAGESVIGIAMRELGDEKRWTEIRDLNESEHPLMMRHDYYPVGSIILLPEK